MPRKKRTTEGMVTVINKELRIVNGDVESLKKLRKPGRPKKTKVEPVGSVPDYPTYDDLQEFDGFHAVRSRKAKLAKTAANQSLQKKFEELASEVKDVSDFPAIGQTTRREAWFDGKWGYFEFDKVGRIEKSVPGSFCSCVDNTEEEDSIACLVHGTKFDDCYCAGIDGLTGYRWCRGHRGGR